ncbi:MAG: dTMP kinase [Anaerolineales bacterium]
MSFFVTLEGPEGSGKSTLIPRLAEFLSGRGYDVVQTREPGGTDISHQIRTVVLDPAHENMHPATEFLLFSAARAQLVAEVIRPHLERGGIVLCDRFADSSLAYQGAGHGLDVETVRAVTEFATGGLRPDLTLLFDLDVEKGLARRQSGGAKWDRLDGETLEFHRRVRKCFLELAAEEPDRWVVVNADRSVSVVEAEVRAILTEHIEARAAG